MTVAISLGLLVFGAICGGAIGFFAGHAKGVSDVVNELKERIG